MSVAFGLPFQDVKMGVKTLDALLHFPLPINAKGYFSFTRCKCVKTHEQVKSSLRKPELGSLVPACSVF